MGMRYKRQETGIVRFVGGSSFLGVQDPQGLWALRSDILLFVPFQFFSNVFGNLSAPMAHNAPQEKVESEQGDCPNEQALVFVFGEEVVEDIFGNSKGKFCLGGRGEKDVGFGSWWRLVVGC